MSLMERRVTDKTGTEAEIEEGEIAGEFLASDREEATARFSADTLPKQEKAGPKYEKVEKKPPSASPSSKQPSGDAQGDASGARAWGSPSSKQQFDNPYGVYTELLMNNFDGHDERRRGERMSSRECEGSRGVGKDVGSRAARGGRGGEDEHPKAGGRGGVASEEREYRKLLENVKSLTKHVSVQDAMKALDAVCRDVKISVKKLEKAWRIVQKRRGLTNIDQCAEIAPLIERVFSGLRAVNAVAGTGVGRSQNLTSARDVMRAAMNYRHILFTAGMKKELEGWVRNSSLYAVEDKEKDKARDAKEKDKGVEKRVSNEREQNPERDSRRRVASGSATPHSGPSNASSEKKPSVDNDHGVRFSVGQTGAERSESEKSVKGAGPPPPPPPLPVEKDPVKKEENTGEGTGGVGMEPEAKARRGTANEKTSIKQEGGVQIKMEPKTKLEQQNKQQEQNMGAEFRRRKREDRSIEAPVAKSEGGVPQGTKRKGAFMESDQEKKPKRDGESTSPAAKAPGQPASLKRGNAGEPLSHQNLRGGSRQGVAKVKEQDVTVNRATGADAMDVDVGEPSRELRSIGVEQTSNDLMVIDGESGGSNQGRSAERPSRQDMEEGPSTPLSTKSGSNDCHRGRHQVSNTQQAASPSSQSKQGPSQQGVVCGPQSSGTVASSNTSTDKRNRPEPGDCPDRSTGDDGKMGGTGLKHGAGGSDLKHHHQQHPQQDSISEGGSLKYAGNRGAGDEGGSSLATTDPMSAPPSTSSRCEPSCLTESDQPTSNWGKPAPAGSFGRERAPSDVHSTPSGVENGDLPNGAPLGLSSADNVASDLPESTSSLRGAGLGAADPVEDMLSKGKLCLVLDLDHTLLNSCKFDELGEEDTMRLEAMLREENRKPEHSRELFRMATFKTWTKLRPGLRTFLAKADECFELWIHTQRSRPYADAVVGMLDPTGALFENRVIAQGSPSLGGVKSLGGGLKGRESLVLIIDDTTSEWGNENRNLFAVERYLYFPVSRKRFGMPGKSLLQARKDEIPTRGMLMIALGVAMNAHRQALGVYRSVSKSGGGGAGHASCGRNSAWDIRGFLQSERKKVLSGVHLVFSHVIPIGQPLEAHPLWKLAEQFGAVCLSKCTPSTTHVVAMMPGTEKVAWAKANNRFVVAPNWLECCCTLWRRANEERFSII
ncbi:hypothetical protein BSKO_13459 [Bryopsis sp. KO-2023]|nr:hypothetical protein BSKO_13459 [Bryopsis sp. KO-2023]